MTDEIFPVGCTVTRKHWDPAQLLGTVVEITAARNSHKIEWVSGGHKVSNTWPLSTMLKDLEVVSTPKVRYPVGTELVSSHGLRGKIEKVIDSDNRLIRWTSSTKDGTWTVKWPVQDIDRDLKVVEEKLVTTEGEGVLAVIDQGARIAELETELRLFKKDVTEYVEENMESYAEEFINEFDLHEFANKPFTITVTLSFYSGDLDITKRDDIDAEMIAEHLYSLNEEQLEDAIDSFNIEDE